MRILVRPNHMEIGGAQLNAIELADAIQQRGHEVVLYAPSGDLVMEAQRRDLDIVPSPHADRTIPRVSSVAKFARFVRGQSFDVIHSYECDATVDSLFGAGWGLDIPVVSTVLSMKVPFYLPRSTPLIVGTRELFAVESRRRPEVYLMEPPIDIKANRPGASPGLWYDGRASTVRERWNVPRDARLVVLVGRLAQDLKLEGVLAATRAMTRLKDRLDVRLLIVGDGPVRSQVERAAQNVNDAASRELVTLTGQLEDPRSVYDAADVVLGMGGSVLRGMAFAKPVIVQGERGFWKTFDADNLDYFRHHGWYGIGNGDDGAPLLAELLWELLSRPGQAHLNAQLARRVVVEEYSLEQRAAELEQIYRRIAGRSVPPARRVQQYVASTYTLAKLETAIGVRRIREGVLSR